MTGRLLVMENTDVRWVLAFDGSCGSCGGVADAVSAACGDRVEVFPLQNQTVSEWRQTTLGDDAPWKPVLLRVSADNEVGAWTGVRLASRLVTRLGLSASVDVLRALGQLRTMNSRGEVRRPGDIEPLVGMSRKRFLRNVGLGAATVAGILATGAAPASADSVKSWERKNAGSLPTTLSDLKSLPIAFRRVAYQEMTPEQRSAAWTEHLLQFAGAASLTSTQRSVFARTQAFAADPANFNVPDMKAVDALSAEVREAFGKEQAATMIAVLGPREQTNAAPAARACTCAVDSDYCTNSTNCFGGLQGCAQTGGCGFFYSYTCDGLCSS